MMSEMTITVIVVSASCHHFMRADSGWSRISWFSRVTLPWLRGGTSVAPWRHKCSHVPVFRRLFDRLPVRISTSDLHHRILRKKLYHIRAYYFGVQFSFKCVSSFPSSVGSQFCKGYLSYFLSQPLYEIDFCAFGMTKKNMRRKYRKACEDHERKLLCNLVWYFSRLYESFQR